MTTITTRAGKGSTLTWNEVDNNFTNLNTDKAEVSDVALKAPLASPTLTGVPLTPTAAVGTNTTQIASTAYTKAEIASDRPYSDTNPIMDSTAAQGTSPRVSRQDHVHPSDTTKANLASPTFTGTPVAPTATVGTNTTQVATTAFTLAEIAANFTGSNQSLSGSGYQKLPGGLIVQWGNGNSSAGSLSVTYPTAFPNAAFQTVANCTTTANVVAVITTQTTSGVTIFTHVGSTGAAATVTVRWIAIGY